MSFLSHLNDSLNSILSRVVMVFVLIITIVVGLQVFCRYVLGSSLIWSEEVSRYLLVWITFLGASIALRKGSHINITMIMNLFPKRYIDVILFLSHVFVTIALLVISFYGVRLSLRNMHQLSVVTRIPIGIVYTCIPIGCFLMVLQMVETMYSSLRIRKKPTV